MPKQTPNHNIPYPVSSDLIKDSSTPAKLASDLQAMAMNVDIAITEEGARAEAAARWGKGQVSFATHPGLDYLPEGFSSLWYRADAPKYGLPKEATGSFHVYPYGGQKQVVFLTYSNGRMEYWAATRLSAAWSSWTLINPQIPENAGGLSPATGAGLKAVGIPCSLGQLGSSTTGQGFARLLQRMPANATRFRVRLRNWNPRFNLPDSPAVALSNVAVGVRSGSTGVGWVSLDSTGTTGDSGYVSRWFSVPQAMLGQDVFVAYGWQSSGDVQQLMATAYTGAAASGALTGTGTKASVAPLFAVLEVEVPSGQPVAAVIGDSIASGSSSTNPVYDSWLDQWGRSNGVVVTHWSHAGDAASRWLDPDSGKWTLYGAQVAPADACFYALGANDIFTSTPPDLSELQENLMKVTASARKFISPNLYAVTITPRNSVTGTAETRRREYNQWLARSGQFRDVFDVAAAISADDETIRPEFNTDGVHFNTAGYAAMAGAINRPVVTPMNRYTVTEAAGRTITSWDYLNSREQLIYGDTGDRELSALLPSGASAVRCVLRRTGNVCTLTMYDVRMPSNGSGNFFVIPAGFRPSMQVGNTAQGLSSRLQATQAGNVQGYNWTAGQPIYGSLTWQTNDPWPTSLPGVAS